MCCGGCSSRSPASGGCDSPPASAWWLSYGANDRIAYERPIPATPPLFLHANLRRRRVAPWDYTAGKKAGMLVPRGLGADARLGHRFRIQFDVCLRVSSRGRKRRTVHLTSVRGSSRGAESGFRRRGSLSEQRAVDLSLGGLRHAL